MTTLNLPANMDFTMGSTEQKMDMTLDDIIKQSRKTKTQRVPIKGGFKTNVSGKKTAKTPAARAALQRSVASRSSNLRQGKFAEARSRNGAGNFAATQAAGKKAFATPVTGRNRAWMKSSDVRRNNFAGQRLVPGQKRNPFSTAPGNMKISVINNGSKVGGQKFAAQPFRRKNVPNIPTRQVQTGQQLSADRMDVDYVEQPQVQKSKARTLDSLFAEIKERRTTQPAVVQQFTSVGTGSRGRGGFAGRRRQGQ